jgi:hypothetical protein
MKTGLDLIQAAAENRPAQEEQQQEAATTTATTTVTDPPPTVTPELTEEQFMELAAKRGFKKDEIKESEEEKNARLAREENELVTFGINNMGMKAEDFAMSKMIATKSDEELAFEDFREEELKINPKLKEETIRNRFAKNNPLGDYPDFEKEESDFDDTDDFKKAKAKYEEQKAQFESDKADAMERIKYKASNVKGKFVAPIERVKKELDNYKNGEKVYLKISNEVDKFAKDFGNKFVYETKDGKIDIDLPSDDFKKEFIEQLRKEASNLQFQYPSGSVDIGVLAKNMLTLHLRENIDGILKSKYYNEGIAEGKRGFKNPITQPTVSGENVDLDAIKKGETVNAEAAKQLSSLRSH